MVSEIVMSVLSITNRHITIQACVGKRAKTSAASASAAGKPGKKKERREVRAAKETEQTAGENQPADTLVTLVRFAEKERSDNGMYIPASRLIERYYSPFSAIYFRNGRPSALALSPFAAVPLLLQA